MRISILHNRDHHLLEDDPGREAREDVVRVAAALEKALETKRDKVSLISVDRDVWAIGKALEAQRPDVVVNLCESLAADSRGEMVVPALLEGRRALHRQQRAGARPVAPQGQGEGAAPRARRRHAAVPD